MKSLIQQAAHETGLSKEKIEVRIVFLHIMEFQLWPYLGLVRSLLNTPSSYQDIFCSRVELFVFVCKWYLKSTLMEKPNANAMAAYHIVG